MVECDDCGGYYSPSRIGAHQFSAHGKDRRAQPQEAGPQPPPEKGKSGGGPPKPAEGDGKPKRRTVSSRWWGQ